MYICNIYVLCFVLCGGYTKPFARREREKDENERWTHSPFHRFPQSVHTKNNIKVSLYTGLGGFREEKREKDREFEKENAWIACHIYQTYTRRIVEFQRRENVTMPLKGSGRMRFCEGRMCWWKLHLCCCRKFPSCLMAALGFFVWVAEEMKWKGNWYEAERRKCIME